MLTLRFLNSIITFQPIARFTIFYEVILINTLLILM